MFFGLELDHSKHVLQHTQFTKRFFICGRIKFFCCPECCWRWLLMPPCSISRFPCSSLSSDSQSSRVGTRTPQFGNVAGNGQRCRRKHPPSHHNFPPSNLTTLSTLQINPIYRTGEIQRTRIDLCPYLRRTPLMRKA